MPETKLIQYNKIRMVLVFAIISAVGFGSFYVMLNTPDANQATHQTGSPLELFCTFVCIVISAPAIPIAMFFTKNPPWYVWVPLAIGCGLFWTYLIEYFLIIRERRRMRRAAACDRGT